MRFWRRLATLTSVWCQQPHQPSVRRFTMHALQGRDVDESDTVAFGGEKVRQQDMPNAPDCGCRAVGTGGKSQAQSHLYRRTKLDQCCRAGPTVEEIRLGQYVAAVRHAGPLDGGRGTDPPPPVDRPD